MKTKILFFFAIFFASLTATGQVCQIGTTTYTTLDAALAAVQNGQTIKLLTDITYNNEIDIIGKTVTFDLNGKALNVSGTLNVENGGVVLRDPANGELNTGSMSAYDGGKATVTNCNGYYLGVVANGVNVYTQDRNVIVDSKTLAIKSVSVYGISGQLLKTVESGSNHISILQSLNLNR